MREMDYTAAQRRDERDAIQKGKSALNDLVAMSLDQRVSDLHHSALRRITLARYEYKETSGVVYTTKTMLKNGSTSNTDM